MSHDRTDNDGLGTCKNDINKTATYDQIRENTIKHVNNKKHSQHTTVLKPLTNQENMKYKNKYT